MTYFAGSLDLQGPKLSRQGPFASFTSLYIPSCPTIFPWKKNTFGWLTPIVCHQLMINSVRNHQTLVYFSVFLIFGHTQIASNNHNIAISPQGHLLPPSTGACPHWCGTSARASLQAALSASSDEITGEAEVFPRIFSRGNFRKTVNMEVS